MRYQIGQKLESSSISSLSTVHFIETLSEVSTKLQSHAIVESSPLFGEFSFQWDQLCRGKIMECIVPDSDLGGYLYLFKTPSGEIYQRHFFPFCVQPLQVGAEPKIIFVNNNPPAYESLDDLMQDSKASFERLCEKVERD